MTGHLPPPAQTPVEAKEQHGTAMNVAEKVARYSRAGQHWAASSTPAVWFWVALAAAAALWVVALSRTQTDQLGDWGLFSAFPFIWYVAAVATFALCLVAVSGRQISGGFTGSALAFLVVILKASPSLVADAPRLPWAYKHVAVTTYIDAFGSVDRSIDIYHRWPGFFSFTAYLGEAIGYRDPVAYAAWAEVAFSLLDVFLVVAIARSISSKRAWSWTTGLVFAIADWVGQSYFAPQSFGLALHLTIILIVLTYLRSAEPRALARPLEALVGRLSVASAGGGAGRAGPVAPVSRRGGPIAIALLLTASVVPSHQLTPYILLLALLPLFALGYVRPSWVGVVMLVLTVSYLVPNIDYIQANWGLFSGFDPFANAVSAPDDPALSTAAAGWRSTGVTVLSVLVVALALGGFYRRIRQGDVRTTLIVAWLAFSPILTLAGQTYGGEARFRIFLFGLPWFAMGVAWLFWSGRRRPNLVRTSWAALSAILALFMLTYYQPETDYRVSASDVAASQWIDGTVQRGDIVLVTSPIFPGLIGPHYHVLNESVDLGESTALTEYRRLLGDRPLTLVDLEQLIPSIHQEGHHTYLVLSDSQERYVVRHSLFSPGELEALEAELAGDSEVDLVYTNGSARIYRYG